MATVRQEQKVYKFYKEGGQWKLEGQTNSFRVSVALLCPALGGSKLLVLMDRKKGEYYLPGFWTEGLSVTPEEAAPESLRWIIPKDLYCRALSCRGLIVNTEAKKFAEVNGMDYETKPIKMVPSISFGSMAAKASTEDGLYDNSLVSLSPDGKAEIIFVFDLVGGDMYGRKALGFLSANPEYDVSRLTARKFNCGLKLMETPARELTRKLVEELER